MTNTTKIKLSRIGLVMVCDQVTRSTSETESILRRAPTQVIVQAAVPQCIALQISGEQDTDPWTTAADLSATAGRIIPAPIAAEAARRGPSPVRLDVIEIIYGVAALAGLPPIKAVQRSWVFQLGPLEIGSRPPGLRDAWWG